MKLARRAVPALLLAFAGNLAVAADDDDIDAETTIRLMDTAEAASSSVVTRDIALPDNARVELPARGKSASSEGGDRGNRDREDRGDRGRSRADEARDNARDMADDARDNRENRGRSDNRPGRPDRPDRPDPPKGPPGK